MGFNRRIAEYSVKSNDGFDFEIQTMVDCYGDSQWLNGCCGWFGLT